MDRYIIRGGNPLVGEVTIGGAKNAALGILAAAIMTSDPVRIENVPAVTDTEILLKAVEGIGVKITRPEKHTVIMDSSKLNSTFIDDEYMKKIRASYYLVGALLGRDKRAEVPLPGGCNIGVRGIDQHLKGFKALGAKVKIVHGCISAEAKELRGAHIFFDKVSVGATINVMMAAALASGRTIIENAAKEPHVVDLANFLNSMGANIRGAGTDVIRIRGVERLHGTDYAIIPDQIEAGTYMAAVAACHGDLIIRNVIPKHLECITAKLSEIGCQITEFDDAVQVTSYEPLTSTQVRTLPYPGFPTDMQPQITVALGLAQGISIVTEGIFDNRFKYVDELVRMGASIKVENNMALITGVSKYTGTGIVAPDLRAGAALVIAGLAAEGETIVEDTSFVERGYEEFDEKLRAVGADITKAAEGWEFEKSRLRIAE
ncbi:MAG: UDP-N-acetylglucosamine 1-carboxyvinyltransferase 2 [Firmicutes bacterium ADurb.Bin354]|nr:MAG: UDP-N-acetylglucosamine 1-carboxyvinyltransferase 2 [Firmicutes bacterium ADurb.Bin354]SCY27523.1 UDP-N-acetylglucosamine 1-carboxyvinyltransferase [Lachnospiraceae bacterium XPB1003]